MSVKTTLEVDQYAAIEWIAIDVPETIDVSLLWRTDVKPEQLNSIPLTVISGRLLPVVTNRPSAWLGSIEGLALAMKGPIAEPVRIRGVIWPLSAAQVLRDRAREWLTSKVARHVDQYRHRRRRPAGSAAAVAPGVCRRAVRPVVAAVRRLRPSALPASTFAALVTFVLAAWLLLDLRWTYNLVRRSTRPPSASPKELDRQAPRRRGRPAVRLRPESEGSDARRTRALSSAPIRVLPRACGLSPLSPATCSSIRPRPALPDRVYFRSGDWFLVYLRKGVQFDAAQGKLRWDNNEPVDAELSWPAAAPRCSIR